MGGTHWTQIVHPDDAAQRSRVLEVALRDGRLFRLDYRVRHRDGAEFWVSEQGQAMVREGQGCVTVEGFLSDITAQRREEEGLAAAKRHLEAHLDNSPLAVIELDDELRIIRWTGGAERLFGWEAAEAMGRRVFDLLWAQGGEADSFREALADSRGDQLGRTRGTHRNCCKDGRLVHCVWSSSALYDTEGRLRSVLAQVLDIPERAEGEDALRLARGTAVRRAAELEAVLHAVPAAVWIAHDPECLSITGNRTANDWLRLPSGAQTSLTAPEAERPTHFEVFQDGRELHGAELPVQSEASGVLVQDFEIEIRLADGDVRFALGNATPLLDERG